MNARLGLTDPDSAPCTIAFTMTLGEWKRLCEQLPQKYPSWKFGEAITKLVKQAETHFEEPQEIKS